MNWKIYTAIGFFIVISAVWSSMMFRLCKEDGYTTTQCMVMLQAQNTTNQNVFGVTK